MSAQLVTYAQIKAAAGATNDTDQEYNEAIKWAWEMLDNRSMNWPFAMKTKTVTATNGAIALADVSDARWISIWSADPRPTTNGTSINAAAPVRIRAMDPDGIWVQTSPNADGSFFVFYVPHAPQVTTTAYNNSTAYAVDAIVLYTDAQCYRCVTATSAGQSPASAAAKWELQAIPIQLQKGIINYVRYLFRDRLTEPDVAEAYLNKAKDALNDEFRKVFTTSPASPQGIWLSTGTWR